MKEQPSMLGAGAAGQAAAAILRTKAEQAQIFQQYYAHQAQTLGPLVQHRQALLAARDAARAALHREYERRDAEIIAHYQLELDHVAAALRAAG